MFVYQVIGIVQKYLSYPVNVDTQLEFGERIFPAVTFCNMNPWNNSQAAAGPLGDLVSCCSIEKINPEKGIISKIQLYPIHKIPKGGQ